MQTMFYCKGFVLCEYTKFSHKLEVFMPTPTVRDILTSSSVQYPYLEPKTKSANPTFIQNHQVNATAAQK